MKTAHVSGFSLIEVMVTLVLLSVGLLGVFGLQARTAGLEFDAHQRSQALSLAREMQATIRASRAEAVNYASDAVSSQTGDLYVGTTSSFDCSATATLAAESLCAWGAALAGEREIAGVAAMGAMLGARGCLIRPPAPEVNALADLYVVVVWQGIDEAAPLPTDALIHRCFNNAAAPATQRLAPELRRGVALRVLIPRLASSAS